MHRDRHRTARRGRPSSGRLTRSAFALLAACTLVGSIASASRAAQTPPAAVKNLTAWYDATDASKLTIASSTSVSQWADKSGNGETLVQSTHAAQPVFANASLNGLGALQFSGGQFLASNDTAFSRLLYPASTVFIVQASSSNTQSSSSVWSGASQSQRFNLALPNNGSCPSMGTGANGDCLYLDFGDTGSINRVNAPADTYTTLGTHLFMGSGQATVSAVLRRDGTTLASSTPVTDAAFSCALTVGARGGCVSYSSYFSGSIGEIVVYDVALDSAHYQLVEGVLACKWGLQSQLPAGHPYRSTCPAGSQSANLASIGGLSAWYDASDASTLTTVNYLSQISDKSGQGNALTQATPASQPYSATVSGQPAFVFGGAQQMLSSTSNTYATGSNPSAMFVVAAFSGTLTGGYAQAASHGLATNNKMRSLGKGMGNALADVQEYWADVNSTYSWSASPSLVYGSFGTAAESIAVNGNPGTSGVYAPNTPASAALFLGSELGTNFWDGPIYEVLIYDAALSTAEQQFVEGYLACKWGLQSALPASHPYKSSCPSTSNPALAITLAVSPAGLQPPGTDLAYTTTFANTSGTLVYNPVVTGPIPSNTWFKLGTAGAALGSTGLSATVTYSKDGGATYTYSPVSGAGGAASGYDANVTNVRWTLGGAVGPASSVNSGVVSYTVRII